MANGRASIHQYYAPEGRGVPEDTRFDYHGPALVPGVVVRLDLNGYSAWARTRRVDERAAQLDSFFSTAVPVLQRHGGVFFRDEGDCIVGLFTDYFDPSFSYAKVAQFCKDAATPEYGPALLTAKAVACCGEIAIFQKAHERATGEWSAEGEPFVSAARLEQALTSTRTFVVPSTDYEAHFRPFTRGGMQEKLLVPGMALAGGWMDITRFNPVTMIATTFLGLLGSPQGAYDLSILAPAPSTETPYAAFFQEAIKKWAAGELPQKTPEQEIVDAYMSGRKPRK